MKLHKNFLICLFAVLCLLALPQTAQAASESDLTFILNATQDGYIVSACNQAAAGELVIPATYQEKPVVGIGEDAFSFCENLTAITIPDSVTTIGAYAFDHCTALTAITIPDSITAIPDYALSYCENLTGITIPDSVTTIGTGALGCCTSLTGITIPNSVTTIGQWAFYGCTGLTGITIPESVTSFGEAAFAECTALTGIQVESGNTVYHSAGNCLIETASKTLVAGCKASQIPADGSVTAISGYAFFFNSSLTGIIIPDSVTTIGNDAFSGCTGLTNVTLSNGITAIGDNAFAFCENLTRVIYCGTQTQWNAIEIGEANEPLTDATRQLHSYENGVCTICGQERGSVVGDLDGDSAVTQSDVVYLLLHSMFGETAYPLNGADADIDGNGTADQNDVVYLLLHTMFGEAFYPLKTN